MSKSKTIRIVMPQWQGGDNPVYHFGAELLAWLAPKNDDPVVNIPVFAPDHELEDEQGIMGRKEVVEQLKAAERAIQEHEPEKIVVLGGDCLVDLAPFAWLSQRYGENFGILWVDTHPDIMSPEQFSHSHAHVLGALMGYGDKDLTQVVNAPVPAKNVMIAGLNEPNEYEIGFLAEKNIQSCSPEEIQSNTPRIRNWIKENNITHLAIHWDLDVLDYYKFRSVLFAEPNIDEAVWDGVGKGKLTLTDVENLIQEVNKLTEIVGIGIAEHTPWDAINLKNTLSKLPLFSAK
ncbi:arginase [Mangrovibacter sp. MFB070]|uniref:arginase family protein n=1 Tax=Mangrovibacter sp. MFB070 TaxID=1224318 RepID=UPI0004D57979|nr:arginase family protein [Mangrovibacter sp. MFB070]KEA53849.1 arginase [Mangrovibacter sp. MFB070]